MRANTTRAAEGFDRRSFTVAEIVRMQDAGIISDDENFDLTENTFVEPDLVVYPKGLKLEDVKGSDILLAIEVAATSLAYDRGLKSRLYARYGVNELWVIDGERRRAFIHSGPEAAGWRAMVERGPGDTLTSAALPGFSARLGSI